MRRAPKVCSSPDCPNTQPCPTHHKKAWAGSTRRERLPRGWDKRRRFILNRDPICRVCSQVLSAEVDHVTPGDDHSHDNLQGICQKCHVVKSSREGRAAKGYGS